MSKRRQLNIVSFTTGDVDIDREEHSSLGDLGSMVGMEEYACIEAFWDDYLGRYIINLTGYGYTGYNSTCNNKLFKRNIIHSDLSLVQIADYIINHNAKFLRKESNTKLPLTYQDVVKHFGINLRRVENLTKDVNIKVEGYGILPLRSFCSRRNSLCNFNVKYLVLKYAHLKPKAIAAKVEEQLNISLKPTYISKLRIQLEKKLYGTTASTR